VRIRWRRARVLRSGVRDDLGPDVAGKVHLHLILSMRVRHNY